MKNQIPFTRKSRTMKKFVRTTAVAAGIIATAMGSAGLASAAATAPVSAATVIQNLQAHGFRVILDKVGAEPLSQCHVISVRRGHPITQTVPAGGGDTVQKVLYTPVYVDVAP
jgi:uncharacterized membrane protein (DUF441 family)